MTTELNLVDDPAIIGNPVLRQATLTNFEVSSEGMIYRVMVRVHNREGYADSPYFRIMNSGFPLPILSSVELISKTQEQMLVKMPLVSDDASVFSYEL